MGAIQKEETQHDASLMSPYYMPPMSPFKMDIPNVHTHHPFHKY